jgi:hypothetical protein
MRQKDIETLQEGKEYVYNQEDSIKRIIAPSDIRMQDLESWDNADMDRLRDELGISLGEGWTYGIDHPYGELIESIAVNRYVEDMTRIPMDHLNPEMFGGIEDMVCSGYWPYETSRDEIRNLVWEWNDNIDYFHEYEQEVMQEIEASILEARLKDF